MVLVHCYAVAGLFLVLFYDVAGIDPGLGTW